MRRHQHRLKASIGCNCENEPNRQDTTTHIPPCYAQLQQHITG